MTRSDAYTPYYLLREIRIRVKSGSIIHHRVENGWFFHCETAESIGVYINSDYNKIKLLVLTDDTTPFFAEAASDVSEPDVKYTMEALNPEMKAPT